MRVLGLGFGFWVCDFGFGFWVLGFGFSYQPAAMRSSSSAFSCCSISARDMLATAVQGLVFGVWSLVFGVWGLGFGVWCLVFGVSVYGL